MSSAGTILEFLHAGMRQGERGVLLTIAHVDGSSPRASGTHMAVLESGRWCGSLSGGCVEAAVVGEALRVLAAGRAELLRLGQGSPLIDIRLPCSGGLDLLIVPDPDPSEIAAAVTLLQGRKPVELAIGCDGSVSAREAGPAVRTCWTGTSLTVRHEPAMRLFAIGHGEEMLALARLSQTFGAQVVALTPDQDIAPSLHQLGAEVRLLRMQSARHQLDTDRYCAAVLLFHDHDWETGILAQLLRQPSFFIGAMGSPRTQSQRLQALRAAGLDETALARVVGPVGLIPSTRDPNMLALSILAQVAAAWSAAAADGFGAAEA